MSGAVRSRSPTATDGADVLRHVLQAMRFEGSVFFTSELTAPWDLPLHASTRPRMHVVLDGQAWLDIRGRKEPLSLRAGDVVLLSDPFPHRLFDDARPLPDRRRSTRGVRRRSCRLVCGSFGFRRDIGHPLVESLPDLIKLSASAGGAALRLLVQLLDEEFAKPGPGGDLVLDRLIELLFIQVLRSRPRPDSAHQEFIAAIDDRFVSRSLQLIHESPERPWTLDSLSKSVGISRAAFARRFRDLVGRPPMEYLTLWRMQRAERMLRSRVGSVAQVARAVGYASPTSFARAFRRHFNRNPRSE